VQLLRAGAALDARGGGAGAERRAPSPLELIGELLRPYQRDAGLLYAWGEGHNFQLGEASVAGRVARPSRVAELPGTVRVVASAKLWTAVATAEGEAWSAGFGVGGRLGQGSERSRAAFARVAGLDNVRVSALAVSDDHAVALSATGGAYTWGANGAGQLGHGATGEEAVLVPRRVAELRRVRVAAAAAGMAAPSPRSLPC
jgi:alpha-tubulin suppressor-like RCC1 family protein